MVGGDGILSSPGIAASPGVGFEENQQHFHGVILNELAAQKQKFLRKETQLERQNEQLDRQIERLRSEKIHMA